MFTIEPTDHWHVGDRAYCLRSLKKDGRHVVERGRVYKVTAVLQMRGVMSDGLHLEGVDRGETDGFWSNRFVCLRGRQLPIRQIAERTRHGWLDAYWATAKARSPALAIAMEARQGLDRATGLDGVAATARASSEASPEHSSSHHPRDPDNG